MLIMTNYLLISLFFQVVLALTHASADTPNEATKSEPQLSLRSGRQYGNYGPGDPNEVVVDIEDDEKTQYYETNYETSMFIFIKFC